MKDGGSVFGGSFTIVVFASWGKTGGAARFTCFGGKGGGTTGGPGGVGEALGAVTAGNCWVLAGGGLATDESMTTTFPARPV
jgi:hypothetical protein